MKKADESFFRSLRLTRARDFMQVFRNHHRLDDGRITLLVGKQRGQKPRLGFAIAKKQIPKATQRNRLKRVFRESFRKKQHLLPARDLVILVRRSILDADRLALVSRLEKHWNGAIKQCKKR